MSFTHEQLADAIEAAFAKLKPILLQAITEELGKLQTPEDDDLSNGEDGITNGDTACDKIITTFFAGDEHGSNPGSPRVESEKKVAFLKQVDGVQVDTLRELVEKCIDIFNTLPLTLKEWIITKNQLIPFDRFDWSQFDQTVRPLPIGILTLNEGVLEHLTSHECAAIWIVLNRGTVHNDFPSIFEVLGLNDADDDTEKDEEGDASSEPDEPQKACPVKAKAAATKKVTEMKKKASKKKASPKSKGASGGVVAKIIKSLSTATAQKMNKAYYNVNSKRAIGESKTNIGKYTYYSAEKPIGELEDGDYIEEVEGMGMLYFAGEKKSSKELSATQKELTKNGWTVTKLEVTA
jgi:hypothetical protein